MCKITENAILPTRKTPHSIGLDLYSAYDYVIPKRSSLTVFTDLSVAIPDGHYGRVAPRSSLAVKYSIDIGAGVVDCDYRGNVFVVMFNHTDKDFKIRRGDGVAQLILERAEIPTSILEVDYPISDGMTH